MKHKPKYPFTCYTIDLMIIDREAFIPEGFWTAVTQTLAVTGGTMIFLSERRCSKWE